MNERHWSPEAALVETIKQTLAANVRRERERGGFSQTGLATASHLERPTIQRLEGAKSEAKLSTLIAIARALHIPLQELLVGLPSVSSS